MQDSLLARGAALGILIAVGGICAIVAAFIEAKDDAQKKNWPATAGKIITAQVGKIARKRIYIPARRSDPLPEPMWQTDVVWAIDVEYEYSIDGQTFSGTRATSATIYDSLDQNPTGPSEKLLALASKLVPNSRTSVHYNTLKPEESYLIFVENTQIKRGYIIGLVCLIIGIAVIACSKIFTR